jgi:hypothetical protein
MTLVSFEDVDGFKRMRRSRGHLNDRPGLLFVYANHFAGAKKDAEDL